MKFLNDEVFEIENFESSKRVYFPLCNENIKGSITPFFNGDLKTDHNHFALTPSTDNELLNFNNCRNIWFKANDEIVNTIGQSIQQISNPDTTKVLYGFLYQDVTRENKNYKINVVSFIPSNLDVELHKVSYKNLNEKAINLKVVTAVPIYGRSADNLRDHRHVTALLNRISIVDNCITNKPTFSFDERGHNLNQTMYSVMVSNDLNVDKYYPTVDNFIGDGTFLMPDAIYSTVKETTDLAGFECMGSFESKDILLQPNEEFSFVYGISICDSESTLEEIKANLSIENFNKLFVQTQHYWNEQTNKLSFTFKDQDTTSYLKWVSIQPILRRIYGCSFLPHHDYGKGGRGYRDLWQDCLALIKISPKDMESTLINNFCAIRIDGSNATIIGQNAGEFKADRNDIVRMWSDHAVWPFITTNTYLKTTNNYDILFKKASYFKDKHVSFSQDIDDLWDGNIKQLTFDNTVYEGTILEHLILELFANIYNIGLNGNVKLMDADWNDGLDMAHKNGETVSFTALYCQNLSDLSKLLIVLKEQGYENIELFEELTALISEDFVLDYTACKNKLSNYFTSVKNKISGQTVTVSVDFLVKKLTSIFNLFKANINKNEWLSDGVTSFYNGYYDNDGKQLESVGNDSKMILTSQVFQISSNIASNEQVEKIISSADKLLYDKNCGGYRLNSNYHDVKTNMGRLFGFAYGHKENGAVFSHMAVMYANSLYKRGYVEAGSKVLNSISESVLDFTKSKMLPGIPEYFDTTGKGMYPYLTGSASWLLLTLCEEIFGVNRIGDEIILNPKLTKNEFYNQQATINCLIDGKQISITYINDKNLDYLEYEIKKIYINDEIKPSISTEDLKNNSKISVIVN